MSKLPDKDLPEGEGTLPAERRTGSRKKLALPVRCRYDSVLDFVEMQSMNISRTGMFIATDAPAPLGSRIDFDFILGDGFSLLKGSAEVMRVVTQGAVDGMGVRFVDLDDANRLLIERIVAVNDEEGRNSTLNFDFSRPAPAPVPASASAPVPAAASAPAAFAPAASAPARSAAAPAATEAPIPSTDRRPLRFDGRNLRLELGPLTVHHFTANALLNVRSGGFFVPAEEDLPLGTVFQVEIVDTDGRPIVAGKGKVVAKQERRIGIRLADADKEGLARLKTEVGKLASTK